MGSLNYDGSSISKDSKSVRHKGHIITIRDSQDDFTTTEVSASGEIRVINASTSGVIFGPQSTTYTIGMTHSQRHTDTSVEREKFTSTGLASGTLQSWNTRSIDGMQISVSTVEAITSLGPSETITERKIFDDGWTIFDGSGTAVGADNGTTDTDVSPNATWDGS